MADVIDTDTTLATLVNERPRLARELERRSIDYCCGGQRTLAEACADAGLDAHETAAELGAVSTVAPEPWAGLAPAELVDHLEATHHAYLHDELPRLARLVDKVVGVHGERHPELYEIRRVFGELRADLEPHLAKEEQVLFPMVRELASADRPPQFHCGTLQNPISVMMTEHDRAGDLLVELRELTHTYTAPADGCASYRALYAGLSELESDIHLHVHKENNVLFPAVVALESSFLEANRS